MPPRHQAHFATFGVDFRQQRRFLLRPPHTPPIPRPKDLHVRQKKPPSGVQKEPPEVSNIAAHQRCRYTRQTGRLPLFRDCRHPIHPQPPQLPPDLRARNVLRKHPDTIVYALRVDRGLSPPDVLATVPGTRWDEERGLDDHQYIVPGAGGIGEILNNAWV